jgi:Uma2 family endonuclease
MQLHAPKKMTVDEFLAWAEENPGRYELADGEVQAMAPQRLAHLEVKLAFHVALLTAIKQAGAPCRVLPDGATVRVSETTAYEPDALVYCGPEKAGNDIEVRDPVIVVEVLSPGTRYIDLAAKLEGYFKVPSVRHYLIADPEQRFIIHHARNEGDVIQTRIVRGGAIALDPPGLTLEFEACFSAQCRSIQLTGN